MPTSTFALATPDGPCTTEIVTPDGNGPWPAIILCYDAGALRPAMTEIATRIAADGYLVATPDLYHREGSVFDILPREWPRTMEALLGLFADDELRAIWMTRFFGTATRYEHLEVTIGALLDHLGSRADVRGPRVGTTGYCMGGNVSLRIATVFGERIAATASFHGGGLAVPSPDSPHLRAARIRAHVYVAGAIEDDSFTDEAKATLEAALRDARVTHTIETYPARHGFAVADHPAYDAAACERHFAAMRALFAATLG